MKMKIEFKEGVFASMKYLDAEIERNHSGSLSDSVSFLSKFVNKYGSVTEKQIVDFIASFEWKYQINT